MANEINELGNLTPAPGSVKKRKRIGRGRGSGHGDTATKGHKGAQSRSGYKRKVGFEGGQMPLQRRIPKRGFSVPNRTEYKEFNLGDLARLGTGNVVNPETLRSSGIVKGRGPVVLLGNGEVTSSYDVQVHRITKSASEKIVAAGGKVTLLDVDPIYLRVKKGPEKKPRKSKKS